jgi:hypothetical protein
MAERTIEPHRVTKPIQLLAAWLVGLVTTNASFLATAVHLEPSTWVRGALIIASVVNVPLFLLALFVLQTRFRAELQEDTFYAEYLSKKSATVVRIDKDGAQDQKIEVLERKIEAFTTPEPSTTSGDARPAELLKQNLDWSRWRVGVNKSHPDFKQIVEALGAADIPVVEAFGKSAPKKWMLAISQKMPHTHKLLLLRTLLPFQIDSLQFWIPNREADETEDVYVGAYGEGSSVAFDKAWKDFVARPDLTSSMLRNRYLLEASE